MKLVELNSKRLSVRDLLVETVAKLDSGEIKEVNDVVVVMQYKGGGIRTVENGLTIAQYLFLMECARFEMMMLIGKEP